MDLFLFMLVAITSGRVVEATTMELTKLLLQDLFQNYSKDIRPVKDQSTAISVNIDVDVVSINDFDEVSGTISMVTILYISWRDESLVWNSTSYGNTTSVTFPQNKIWLPKMFLCNPADKFQPITNKHFIVSVTSDGHVSWAPGALLTATCTPDVFKYPFDQQTCSLQLNPWGYSSQQVKLNIPSSTMLFNYFSVNSEWDVLASYTSRWTQSFDMAIYYITIKRRHLNFLVSVVIPVIMLALVNPFVFILPFNSGERASYSITVLLAFTVYMTVVSDRMPASSQPMSYISYYLLSLVGISVIIVTMNIFQMRTYTKHDDDEPVPEWLKKLYLFSKNKLRGKNVNVSVKPVGTEINSNGPDNKDLNFSKMNNDFFQTSILSVSQVDEKPPADNEPTDFHHQSEKVTWHMVAKVVDKLYFVLFLVITVVATVSYFIIAH
ncbi:acetylcholine receptor subunit alpha-like [Ylistrum balloti]|uniref:acetylcholine receptor subunit alpha-like n=1 Tax=Ylistrum balloti TaxID=509963 RepID=UPI002905EA38|nr:acetylcholine receptor subunit alpha-like [Ylistrum balloti]